MENKYQESLNRAFDCICSYRCKTISINECKFDCPVKEDKEVLKELVDKTTICGLSLDEAIPVILMYKKLKHTIRQHAPIQDLMMGTKNQYYYDGKHSISQLEKALDKLLDMCTDDVCCLSHNCPNIKYDFDTGICVGECPTKEEIKEYLLKEVQDGK